MTGLADQRESSVQTYFWKAMAALGPYERAPRMAAAVSGGSDSMALASLMLEWTRRHRGSLHILTIDHGLRPGSAADCAFVADEFSGLPEVTVDTLIWAGPHPDSGIQEAARSARYRLLSERCRKLEILHLCLGHTLEDQAETLAIREAHASTSYGLAGMPSVRPMEGIRLLRPLLGCRREALSDWLRENGRPWREDPSNLSDRFERVRAREAIISKGNAEVLAARANDLGRERDRLEKEAAWLLANAASLYPTGYAEIDPTALALAPLQVREVALSGLVSAIGGAKYRPGRAALKAIALVALGDAAATTQCGCVVRRRRGQVLVSREASKTSEMIEGEGDWSGLWDNRFRVKVEGCSKPWCIRAIGDKGLERLALVHGIIFKRAQIPLAARRALPSLWKGEELLCVPQLNWGQGLDAAFSPVQSATGIGFPVVQPRFKTI